MEITGKTSFTGLLGQPVSHSISPQMHNAAFQLLSLDYVYLAFDVSPGDLPAAVAGLKAAGIRGFNVTMPHKAAMVSLVDELTPAASIAQACNTIINENGYLIGHTTDGVGFMQAVSDAGHNIIGKKMTLLGCGGAAAAIAAQAAIDGVSAIDIFEQNAEPFRSHAESFADRVRTQTSCNVQVLDIADKSQLRSSIESSTILTNATNVGMEPDTDNCLVPDPSYFHPGLIVFDIIYHPKETRLLQMASKAGCPTANGMYMLLFQGAASFRCWTGKDMPIEAIRSRYFSD